MTVQVKCHLITLRRTKGPRICCELSWLKSIVHGRWISWWQVATFKLDQSRVPRLTDTGICVTAITSLAQRLINHGSISDKNRWFFLPEAYVSLPGQCAPGINRPKAICWPHPSSGRNFERTEIITDYPRGAVGRVWRGVRGAGL